MPSKIALTGIFNIPFGFKMSLIYTGQSGVPFTYFADDNDALWEEIKKRGDAAILGVGG